MPPSRIVLWVASIGAIALCVRSVVIGPVPLHVAAAAFGGYLVLAVTGVLAPQLEMFGDVVSRGDPTSRVVALTFDDGPHPETTPMVLDALAKGGVTATFFVVGEKVERHPDVVRAIVAAGHSLGVHGYRHDRLYAFLPPKAVAEDIRRAAGAVERACGVSPRWFRPPVGQVSPRTYAGARRQGLPIVAWSTRGLDGLRGATPSSVAMRIERGLRPGAIVLLHDAAEHDDFVPASIEALPAVLRAIEQRGLRVAPLSDVIGQA
jgi:peptidoglycan/xylan/chitin deacetylase (PgdA/CDA1 family)